LGQTRTTHDDDRRARILEAARRLCARAGFDAVRMEAIAAEAHVSKGTLYRFFASKEDLLLASLIDSHMRESYTEVDPLGPAPEASPERLAAMLDDYAASLGEATERMPLNLQVWALAAEPERREALHRALREKAYPLRAEPLLAALREGMRAGRYRADVDAEAFVATLLAVFDGLLYRSTFDPDHAHAARLREGFRILLDAIRVEGAAKGEDDPKPRSREGDDGG
jgi:AcrR family transcriptional regulator